MVHRSAYYVVYAQVRPPDYPALGAFVAVQEVFSNDVGKPDDPAHRNRPLVLHFGNPAVRIQFVLANGSEGLPVVFRAYDLTGRELGELDYSYLNAWDSGFTSPLLMGTSSPDGISTLVVDYGDSDLAEQLGRLRVAFLEAPVFETYLPVIAAGHLGIGKAFSTALTIVRAGGTATGSMAFFDPDGVPLPVQFEVPAMGRWSVLPFDAERPLRLVLRPPANELIMGSVRIRSRGGPVSASAMVSLVDQGQTVSQLGLAAVPAAWRSSGFVRYRPATTDSTTQPAVYEPEINTAISIVNTGDSEADVRFSLSIFAGWATYGEETIPARGRVSRFITELFPGFHPEGFEGRFSVSGDAPLAVTLLETQEGLPLASLPVTALPVAKRAQ
ncbi:MAG: hypothetical protein WAO20_14665 [Acidobacteriota bacterium]